MENHLHWDKSWNLESSEKGSVPVQADTVMYYTSAWWQSPGDVKIFNTQFTVESEGLVQVLGVETKNFGQLNCWAWDD
jgi:hypothetical protein